MGEDFDKVGMGDTHFETDEHKAGAKPVAGNPGYESEAAFRHRNDDVAMESEIRPNQLMPGPLDEHEEASIAPHQIPFREDTRHHSK